MDLIRNERIKLLATYINSMAVALFAVGGLAPLFSYLYQAAEEVSRELGFGVIH